MVRAVIFALVALVGSTAGFAAPAGGRSNTRRVSMSSVELPTSRRAALAQFVAGAAAVSAVSLTTTAAFADSTEDAIQRIAEKTKAKEEARKEAERQRIAKQQASVATASAAGDLVTTGIQGAIGLGVAFLVFSAGSRNKAVVENVIKITKVTRD